MQKLENTTLQKFLDIFVKELKKENDDRKERNVTEINIPFIISSLYQSFRDNEYLYKELIEDLKEYCDYSISISDSKNDYDGIIDVQIGLIKYIGCDFPEEDCRYPNYDYWLCFSYDTRDDGYCQCTPDMKDYREDKHCCGHGCDASFCEFGLHKVLLIEQDTWQGDEHDYWEFEDEFYMSDKELADKKAKEDKERMIKSLKETIENATKKLAELESK